MTAAVLCCAVLCWAVLCCAVQALHKDVLPSQRTILCHCCTGSGRSPYPTLFLASSVRAQPSTAISCVAAMSTNKKKSAVIDVTSALSTLRMAITNIGNGAHGLRQGNRQHFLFFLTVSSALFNSICFNTP